MAIRTDYTVYPEADSSGNPIPVVLENYNGMARAELAQPVTLDDLYIICEPRVRKTVDPSRQLRFTYRGLTAPGGDFVVTVGHVESSYAPDAEGNFQTSIGPVACPYGYETGGIRLWDIGYAIAHEMFDGAEDC